MKVTVGFSTSGSFVSRAIRWFTRAPVSHAFLVIEEIADGWPAMVLEAAWDGWRMARLAEYGRGGDHLVARATTQVALEAAFLDSLKWLGERYDYDGIAGMAVVAIGRWLGRKWRNPVRSSTSMFCSEAVVYVLQRALYPGASCLDPQSVSPADLLEFLKGSGAFVRTL